MKIETLTQALIKSCVQRELFNVKQSKGSFLFVYLPVGISLKRWQVFILLENNVENP